jgi:hypothetical protein
MFNLHVLVWLVTGGALGGLAIFQRHFSVAELLVPLVFAMALLMIFDLIRRQPVR